MLNAGSLGIYGAELEAVWVPVTGLTLQAQVGLPERLLRRVHRGGAGPEQPVVIRDRSGDEPPFAPNWTARVGASYEFGLGDMGSLTLAADWHYRGEAWLSVDNRDVLTQDAFSLFNALATWQSPVADLACVGRHARTSRTRSTRPTPRSSRAWATSRPPITATRAPGS